MIDQDQLAELITITCTEAIDDVNGLLWTVDEEEFAVRTTPRDPSYERRTNVVGIVGIALVDRIADEIGGAAPLDKLTVSHLIDRLNAGRFSIRAAVPTLDEDTPDFVPQFELAVDSVKGDVDIFARVT